jgi:hypothetical protein
MSDFFTVIVSNDDGTSLGMFTLQEPRATVNVAKATAIVFTFLFFILFQNYFITSSCDSFVFSFCAANIQQLFLFSLHFAIFL